MPTPLPLDLRPEPGSRAVVKLEEGLSGEGNATFRYEGAPDGTTLESWIAAELPGRLKMEAPGLNYERYAAKFASLGGVAEAWIDGDDKHSPSAQLRINPLAGLETISTHDQVLGGATGQIYLGARFPAGEQYRLAIQESAVRIGRVLRDKGVIGRFGVDFVCVREGGAWRHHAIEINLRKGGTTHTFQTLQYLTDGHYDAARSDRPRDRTRAALRPGRTGGSDVQPDRRRIAVR